MDNSTPYEEWTGRKPYVGFVRIFGSRVVALNKRHRYNKFAPKGEERILVGYSEEAKAYRLWERESKKVEISRFLEDQDVEPLDSEETFFGIPLNHAATHQEHEDEELQGTTRKIRNMKMKNLQ